SSRWSPTPGRSTPSCSRSSWRRRSPEKRSRRANRANIRRVILAAVLALGLAAPRGGSSRPPPPPPPPPAASPTAPAKAPPPPAAPGGPNPNLTKAEKLLDDLDYDGAALALLQAKNTPGNDRPTLLRILELQGVVAATLDQKSSSATFF